MTNINIIVKQADLKKNAREVTDTLAAQLYQDNNSLPFLERVFKVFPELRECVHKEPDYQELYCLVEKTIEDRFQIEEELIKARVLQVQELINKKVIPAVIEMADCFQLYYKEHQVIHCCLGLFNPFPRDVLRKEYCLHYGVSDEVIIRSSLHEINHMLLFDKWKSMHGYESECEPSYPDTLWYLEELAIEPTLNDVRIQSLAPYLHKTYDSFYEIRINGITLVEHIQRIYDQSKDMEEFLNHAFHFISDNMI